jgi:hypothetical protein
MFPQEAGAGRLEFARAAVAGAAGIAENLRGRLAGVEIRLGADRGGGQPDRSADDPSDSNSTNPQHDDPLRHSQRSTSAVDLPSPLLGIFGQKEVMYDSRHLPAIDSSATPASHHRCRGEKSLF